MTTTPHTNPVKTYAADLRATLKAAYPDAKFSVTLSRGTGYGWINASWTDGPTVKQMEATMDSVERHAYVDGVIPSRSYSPEFTARAHGMLRRDSEGAWMAAGEGVRVFAPWPHADADMVARLWMREVTA